MAMSFKLTYRCNTNPVRIGFFPGLSVDTDKLTLKFICKLKGCRIVKQSWKRSKVEGELILPHFKLSQDSVIMAQGHKYRWMEQELRRVPNNGPPTNGIQTTAYPHAKNKTETLLHSMYKKLTHWFKTLFVRAETKKLWTLKRKQRRK